MTTAQRLASIARHWRFLGAADRAALAPCPSEQAVQQLARRMWARLPGV